MNPDDETDEEKKCICGDGTDLLQVPGQEEDGGDAEEVQEAGDAAEQE